MLLSLLLACSAGPDDSACAGPTLTLLSPADGAVVSAPLTVETDVSCFTLVPEGDYGDDVADDVGHLHVFLNGQERANGSEETVTINDVEPGLTQVRVELALANHQALQPYVGTTVYVTIEE